MPFSEPSLSERLARRRLSLQGIPRILEKPEFQNIRKVRPLLSACEEKSTLTHWLVKNADADHVAVSVGREHDHEALEDCAIVMARYSVAGSRKGAIAILGPKRMPYRRIIPLVSRMAGVVGEILERMEREDL